MKAIHAIYENGIFRPTEPVDLPEFCPVLVAPQPVASSPSGAMARVYETLRERFDSGETDVAERHNEHQP
jgi:predicted DNA-binding antitoxin AbrB/MazE fold protein